MTKEEPNSYRRIAQALERDSFHSGRGRGVSKFSGCLSASFSRRSRAKHPGNSVHKGYFQKQYEWINQGGIYHVWYRRIYWI